MTKQKDRRRLTDLMETIRVNHGTIQYYLLEMYIAEKERYKERWNEDWKYERWDRWR